MEIRKLHEQFRILSDSKDEDIAMDKRKFLKALGLDVHII